MRGLRPRWRRPLQYSYDKKHDVIGPARSLRVAFVVFALIVIVMFCAIAFVFLFVFFLVWLLPKEDIGSYRPIRRVWVGDSGCILLMSNGTPRTPWQTLAFPMPRREELFEREDTLDFMCGFGVPVVSSQC